MKNLALLMLTLSLLGWGEVSAQTLRLPWTITSTASGAVVVPPTQSADLAIIGPDSVAEGSTGSYQVFRTLSNGTSIDVSDNTTLTASRGAASGVTLTKGTGFSLSVSTNTIRGNHRITTLRATYNEQTVSREIVLKDATAGYTGTPARMVTSADMALWPQMKLGDFLIGGATLVSSGTDHSISVQNSQGNVPTLAPGATVWIRGGKYINFTLQLNQSRVAVGQPPVTIRNYDGQVEIKNSMTLLGAQGVKTTGRYEPGVGGDSDYRGHDAGFAYSDGRYGIYLNNQWSDTSKPGLYGYNGVNNLEYEYIQVSHGFFAAVQLNNDNFDMNVPGTTDHTDFDNLSLHDLLIYDVDSEGVYIGSTGDADDKAFVKNLKVYNNRILFVGSEALQTGQIKSADIYNNVTLADLLWRDNFQQSQDNNTQLHVRYGKALTRNNLLMGSGEKFINGQSEADGAAAFSTTSADTVVYRNNSFLYSRGPVYGYFNTRTVPVSPTSPGGKRVITGMNLKFDQNLFGFQRFIYNQVYGGKTLQPYMFQFDIISANIFLTNNTFDGSSSTKTTWFTNGQAGTTTVTQSGNSLSGTVPTPDFVNLAGSIPVETLARTEFWRATSAGNYGTTTPGLIKAPITFPAGEVCTHKGAFYEALQDATSIEPGVTAGWQTYWNRLYWDRTTGEVVRNPSTLTGLSASPPMDVRAKPGSFYRQRGIGLLD